MTSFPINDPNDPVLMSLKESLGLNQPRPKSFYSPNTVHIPLIGSIVFVRDKQGIMMLSGILAYWIYGVWSSYYVILQPHYEAGHIKAWFLYYHFIICVLCLVALFRASTQNPGEVPHVTEEFAKQNKWEICPTCGKWRPNKSHHCRRCQQCVARMDHHCPWINNCVGEGNHYLFMQLLFYAFLFSTNTLIALLSHFWVWPKCTSCDQESFPIKYGLWFSYLSFVMSIAMAGSMFSQFFAQHFNLMMNRTTIDNMKINSPDDVDYSTLQIRSVLLSYSELCGTRRFYMWPWPCRGKRSSLLTGVSYA
ncbi:Palmitoyltransferase zdhhc21 [Mactra antiquata]